MNHGLLLRVKNMNYMHFGINCTRQHLDFEDKKCDGRWSKRVQEHDQW
jgi:hypothetical protein